MSEKSESSLFPPIFIKTSEKFEVIFRNSTPIPVKIVQIISRLNLIIMKMKFLLILAAFNFFAFINCWSQTPQTDSDKLKIERLTALCKLWGEVRYFHPALAYRSDIDWDATLIQAIPKVNNAKTSDEYRTALQSMLDVLNDPLTQISHTDSTEPQSNDGKNQTFDYRLTEDGVMIIAAGNYFEFYDQLIQQKLRELSGEISKAKAIVFDLRAAQPGGDYGNGALAFGFSQIERMILSSALETPGERSRLYRGFENDSFAASGQYKTGFYTQNGKRITPARNAKDIPSITILNKNSGLLDSTLPLQASGKNLIVFEGDAKEGSVGKTESVMLGENLTAQIRVSEPIYEDGTSGDLQPDAIVAISPDKTDKAIETALELARNFKPSAVVRRKLPATAVTTLDKSYSQMQYPPFEYRLLAAFRIWNIVNYFHPYKNLITEDWDGVLREFIPKFEVAKDALEYNLAVAEMVTHIHDSHSYVAGDVINEYSGTGYPPIRVRLIENELIVTNIFDETAKSNGLKIGDIVVKVDGEDAKMRFARYAKYISASTPQSNADKATIAFMNGKDKSVVTIKLRDANGTEKEIKLTRKYEDFTTLYHRERTGDILKLLPGNIGYADLDRLTADRIDEMLEKFKNTKAIIFDMRGYPNGIFYWLLAPRLTEKQNVPATLLETPLISQFSPMPSSEANYQLIQPTPPGKWIYKGKTVMLIDERAESQAEHTGLFFRAANGTKFIGSPTAGADGELATFSVPGGITIGFSAQSVRFPDGKQLQRIGLVPDVLIKPTIKGVRAGRDEVLEKAIQFVKSNY